MEINQQKTVKVNAKTLRIHCKVSDRFTYAIDDEQGEEIHCQDDGYVPDFMPGEHYGDYVVYLEGLNAVPTLVESSELVPVYDHDRFTTTRKGG